MSNRLSLGSLELPADDGRFVSNFSSVGGALSELGFLTADLGSNGLGGFCGFLPGKMMKEP